MPVRTECRLRPKMAGQSVVAAATAATPCPDAGDLGGAISVRLWEGTGIAMAAGAANAKASAKAATAAAATPLPAAVSLRRGRERGPARPSRGARCARSTKAHGISVETALRSFNACPGIW